ELALRELEWSASRALWQIGLPYPSQELQCIWREMLLYQFHDILPGSSITRVYDESRARYLELLSQTQQLNAEIDQQLSARVDTSRMQRPVILYNSLSWPRHEFLNYN